MSRDKDIERLAEAQQGNLPVFTIRCGMPAIERLIVDSLALRGFRCDANVSIMLLVDAPQGFALRQFERLDRHNLRVIVTTSNHVPEYWEDLWELNPAVLIVGHALHAEVDVAIMRAARGEHYRIVPPDRTELTRTEREVLRLVAHGWTNEQIGAHRGVSPKTICNTVATICEKLQLRDRMAAAFYYWGRSDLLD